MKTIGELVRESEKKPSPIRRAKPFGRWSVEHNEKTGMSCLAFDGKLVYDQDVVRVLNRDRVVLKRGRS